MDTPLPPDAATLERRLGRERAARREAEAIAEQITRELYEAVQQLAASKAVLDETTDFVAIAGVEGRPMYLNRAHGQRRRRASVGEAHGVRAA